MTMVSTYEKTIRLRDCTEVFLRPLLPTDSEQLWQLFAALSRDSLKYLGGGFTRERIERWTSTLDYERTLPIIAVVEEHGAPRIVVSAALSFHPEWPAFRHKAVFSITVHDDYQNRGLGTALTRYMIDIARQKQLHKVSLKVRVDNARAIHVYERCGFTIEATLKDEHLVDGIYYHDYMMSIFFDP